MLHAMIGPAPTEGSKKQSDAPASQQHTPIADVLTRIPGNQARLRAHAGGAAMQRPSRMPVHRPKCGCGGSCADCGRTDTLQLEAAIDQDQQDADAAASRVARSPGTAATSNSELDKLPYRAELERAFNEEFSDVKVHLGEARGSGQGAFATHDGEGDMVAFERTSPSREQVAHELVHVTQRRRFGDGAIGVAGFQSPSEVEARALAPLAARGQTVAVRAPPAGRIQRDGDVAQRIHDDLHGWIRDDEVAALRELRSDRDRAGTCRTYQSRFGYSLWGDFIDNASGDTLNQALALLWPYMTLLQRLSTKLGVDDDEKGILQTIMNASDAEVLAAGSGLQRYLDQLDAKDQYTARQRISPKDAVANVVWFLKAGRGYVWDDEGPVATAILSLTPADRAKLWKENQGSFGMYSEGDLKRIRSMCITNEGTKTTDATALQARMELATVGWGTDEKGVQAAVTIAGNRRNEQARIEKELKSGTASTGAPLTNAQRVKNQERAEEIGDVKGLLTPTKGPEGKLAADSFLGLAQDDVDTPTMDALMVTAHVSAFDRAKQALLATKNWIGDVKEAEVLRIYREAQGELTLPAGKTINDPKEVLRLRAMATAQLRARLRADHDLIEAGIWSSLGNFLGDDSEIELAEAISSDNTFEIARLDLIEAFEAVDVDDGRILRVLRDASPEVRARLRKELPDPIGRIRSWAGTGPFAQVFEDVLKTGIIETKAAIQYAVGGEEDEPNKEMITDVLDHLTDKERAQLRRGYQLIHASDRAPGIPLSPKDQAAVDRYNTLYLQLQGTLTDEEELDAAIAAMLDLPTVAEVAGSDGQGRLDAAAILLYRQRERLELTAGLTDFVTTTDNAAAGAHIEFEARYNLALEDGEITPDEFLALVRLDTVFNENFAEYSATANMISEIAGTVAAVAAAAVVVILSGGAAAAGAPGMIAWLSANSTLIGTTAAAGALAQVSASELMGGDFNDALGEEGRRQALSGALSGALMLCGAELAARAATLVGLSGPSLTAAIARAAADATEISVVGHALARGTLTGLIDGALGGAVGELAMTLSDARTWRHTVWEVMAAAGESLVRGAALGGVTGAATGGVFEILQAKSTKRALEGVDVKMDASLGSRAHIDYTLNPDGTLQGLALRIGENASHVDVAAHVDRIVAIKHASGLLSRARAAITGIKPPQVGTVSGDAAHEVAKIGDLIEGRLRQLGNEMSAADRQIVEAELEVLDENLKHYTALAHSGNASPSNAGGIAQPTAPPGYPSPPEGHYYRRRDSGWDLQRYPDSDADPFTLQRNAAGDWEVVGRKGGVATAAAVFPVGTTPQQAFAQLTDPNGTSSFRAYWEMLRDNKLATREEVIAAMRDPSGATVNAVRHDLKVTFESRVLGQAERTADGVARTEAESMVEMRRMIEGLDSPDHSGLLEKWYLRRRPGLVVHPSMKDADNPGLVVGREGRGVRIPDFVEGEVLVEMKSHRFRLAGEDVAQVNDGLRVSGAGGIVRLQDGTTRVVKAMRVVFTDIRGGRANADQIAEWINKNKHLTVEVFDSSGAAHSLSRTSLPGLFERYGVSTVQDLLGAM